MSIVEKVARAIMELNGPVSLDAWENTCISRRNLADQGIEMRGAVGDAFLAARAAIEAMREPSEAMLQAVVSEFSPPGAELVAKGYWTAMISAALEGR